MSDHPDWEADPRSDSEVLRAWAERHGVTRYVAQFVSDRLAVPLATAQGLLVKDRGKRRNMTARRLMAYVDRFGPLHDDPR